ncbi:MAG: zinc ABC transporter substrate-binding protein, partial [Actinomycetota bacterium]
MPRRLLRLGAVLFAVMLFAAACGSDSDDDSSDASAGAEGTEASGGSDDAPDSTESADRPTIAVTTNILGDVVTELVGDQADVLTVMPVGADPHDFQASAQEVDALLSADALIVNGANFEEGLLDVIDTAGDEGLPTHEAMEGLETLEFGEGGHDHGHDEEGHSDEDGHDHDEEGHSDEEKDEDGHDHSDEEGHSDEEKDEDGHDHSDEEGHSD